MIHIKPSHLLFASAAPVAIVVLAVVLTISRGRAPAPSPPKESEVSHDTKSPKQATRPGSSGPDAPRTLALAADGFDQIGTILDNLGAGYKYEVIDNETLTKPTALSRFDVVFLTCAGVEAAESTSDLPKAIHEYVSRGGTLYASDLRFDTLAEAFPEFVDRASIAQGTSQDLHAEVTSPELRDLLGPETVLHFGEKGWRPAAFRGDEVSVLLKGQLNTTAGASITAPLLVRFPVGKGTVLFTSFHHGGRVSDDESKLLRFLILKTVTSASESSLTDALADDGFSPRAVAAVAVAPDVTPAPRVYLHEKVGPLRFRLRPARSGARLRLEVVGPDGKTTTKEGDSTLAIDLPDAAPGRWQYRVGVVEAPYLDFPAVLVLGTPEAASSTTSVRMNLPIVKPGGNIRFQEVNLGNKPASRSPRRLRIAVTEPRFDDMGRLLRALGEGYPFTQIGEDDLIRPHALDRYDVLFLTCNSSPGRWFIITPGPVVRADIGQGEFRPEIGQIIHDTLNRFVGHGGTLYVSDFRKGFLMYAFPDRIPAANFDIKLLPAVDRAEKIWLKSVVPQEKILTVSETVDSLKLGQELLAHRDELLAVLHTSTLVTMKDGPGDNDYLDTIRARMSRYNLPATNEDCVAIARAFEVRKVEIARLYQSRNQAKLKKAVAGIIKDEMKLTELRNKLVIDDDGAGRQTVDAQVVDPGLQESIGDTIRLRFPDNAWVPARFRGDDVKILMRGTYRSVKGQQLEAPLLVRFRQGKGTVIFTSFHNEAQNSQQELELLRYLVFSAVTAQEEALTQETLLSGGFSPVKQSQVNHQVGNDTITKKYQTSSGDPLRFALTFAGTGARLRLTLVAPGGQEYEKETDETFVVEATGAPAGGWLYTVTAIKVPYENFAYSVSIGKAAGR